MACEAERVVDLKSGEGSVSGGGGHGARDLFGPSAGHSVAAHHGG